MVGILMIYQWSNCAHNMTTIEHLQYDAAESRSRRTGIPLIFPYDMNTVRNLKLILGKRLWAWPIPMPSSWQLEGLGRGILFEKCTSVPWPPERIEVDYDTTGNEEESLYEQRKSRSDPILSNPFRDRYRRGSEGYMIPADEIGVQFHDSSSSPLLI